MTDGSTDPRPPGAALLDAVAVMDRLRSPGGCPWDAEQTHASLAKYAIEEAYDLGPATRFRAGTPVDPPTEVVEALRGVAARHPEVERVRLLLVQIDEPAGRTWPVVGVLTRDGADAEPVLDEMVTAVEGVTEEHVSFTALPPTEGSEFEQVLRENGLEIV